MRTTLAQAKARNIGTSFGIPSCDPRFVTYVNDAQLELSLMGKWWGSYKRMRTCILANCITWPRDVAAVLGFNVCAYTIPIRNMWYEFRENVVEPKPGCGDWTCDQNQLLSRNTVCTFKDISTYGKVRIVSSSVDDGARVLLQGNDPNGVPIRTLDGTDYIEGEYVTLAQPYVESVNSFKNPGILGVQKPITQQRLLVYSVDPVTSDTTQIGIWEASEENPDYIRNYLPHVPELCQDTNSADGTCGTCVDTGDGCAEADTDCTGYMADALVRMEFVPALVDTDWLYISNLNALKLGMQAIDYREKSEFDQSVRYFAMAKQILQQELDKYSPRERTVINVETMGTAKLPRIMGGFI